MHVTLSFYKGSKGGDTVPDEVIGLAEDIQIDLSHLRLQAHDFDLSLEELLYFLRVGLGISSNINRLSFCLLHPELESTFDLFEVRQAHVHGEGHSSAAVIAHALR